MYYRASFVNALAVCALVVVSWQGSAFANDEFSEDFSAFNPGEQFTGLNGWSTRTSHPQYVFDTGVTDLGNAIRPQGGPVASSTDNYSTGLDFSNAAMTTIHMTAQISETGGGDNSNALLSFRRADGSGAGFGSGLHSLHGAYYRFYAGGHGDVSLGNSFSTNNWYDVRTTIDWTSGNSTTGYGAATMHYRPHGTSNWLASGIENFQLSVSDPAEIAGIGLRTDGFTGRRGNIASVQVSNHARPSDEPVDRDEFTAPDFAPEARNLFLITHGWNDSAAPGGWVADMADAIEASKADDSWEVNTFDWSFQANNFASPWRARERGLEAGRALGLNIKDAGFENVHLIAHSAGAWVIDEAADALRSHGFADGIQLTFLDAFTPYLDEDKDLGDTATVADHYVTGAERGSLPHGGTDPFTRTAIENASNYEIMNLSDDLYMGPFASHSFAHEWYEMTARSSSLPSEDAGYGISVSARGVMPNLNQGLYTWDGSSWVEGSPIVFEERVDRGAVWISETFDSPSGIVSVIQHETDGLLKQVWNLVTGSPVWSSTVVAFD